MAYLVRCRYCHYHYFSVSRKDAEAFIIEHISDKHSEADLRFTLVRISPELYVDYLRCRDNPKFWESLRLVRKPHKLPIFDRREGDKP